MTTAQSDVLLALNQLQMRLADFWWSSEDGIPTYFIARECGRSNRSTAVVLSQMRDFGWVQSCHGRENIAWWLVAKGVRALERERRTPTGGVTSARYRTSIQ